MEIKKSVKEELVPFLDDVFKQQHDVEFSDGLAESTEQPLVLAAWVEDQLAGGIVGRYQYDTLYISLLGVDARFQKLGIGSELMRAIEKQAVEKGLKTITLTTKAYQALDFYLKQGYEVFGEIADVPMVGTTKYYLAKRISK
ncbi:GNAT family N-acetyltransferase [Enterococcus viikkiensis]|uniref:GNAT family N-acetyltransferase n=1 Tax=Enterococcus viikkiensis TaxID=930854 RepID=A0ABU3FMP3_9ENTE|nr:GNAT family N-acetyltransferase [Enterococcus viikkiensis]MDT2827239.1 GNAT family N-acetyltransferase [Enterococcus viikkiensis]